MEKPNPTPQQAALNYLALTVVQSAELQAVIRLVEAVCQALPIDQIQGLPVVEFYKKCEIEELQSKLIQVENKDPAFAAALQARIDGLGKGRS